MLFFIYKHTQTLLTRLFGTNCAFCGKTSSHNDNICGTCVDELAKLENQDYFDILLNDEQGNQLTLRALFLYNGFIRDFLIHQKKRSSPYLHPLVAEWLHKKLEAACTDDWKMPFIWIPGKNFEGPHLVEKFLASSEFSLAKKPLIRRKSNKTMQKKRNKSERDETSIETGYKFKKAGAGHILFDDICTTGNTLMQSSLCLGRIEKALVLAYTPSTKK